MPTLERHFLALREGVYLRAHPTTPVLDGAGGEVMNGGLCAVCIQKRCQLRIDHVVCVCAMHCLHMRVHRVEVARLTGLHRHLQET